MVTSLNPISKLANHQIFTTTFNKRCQIRLRVSSCQNLQVSRTNLWSTPTMANSKWSLSRTWAASPVTRVNTFQNSEEPLKVWPTLNNSWLSIITRSSIIHSSSTSNSIFCNKVRAHMAKEMRDKSRLFLIRWQEIRPHRWVNPNSMQLLSKISRLWELQTRQAMECSQHRP